MGMEKSDNQKGILQSLDWWTIGIYLALLAFGWVSVCGASYTYGDTDRLDRHEHLFGICHTDA